MKLKSLVVGAAAALTMVSPALADLTFPNLTYRTGPYAVNGIPYADGYADYMTLLNERDGGIGGEKINYIDCLLYTSPSPRDQRGSRMPSSA